MSVLSPRTEAGPKGRAPWSRDLDLVRACVGVLLRALGWSDRCRAFRMEVAVGFLFMEADRTFDVGEMQRRLREFTSQRDWEQFHSPKNLSMALAAEAGELIELFQWLTEEQSTHLSEEGRLRVEEEIADIQIYLLRLTDVLNISLPTAVEEKIALNERKYPVETSRGDATKYSRKTDKE